MGVQLELWIIYKYSQIKSLGLNYSPGHLIRKPKKPDGIKLGAYSPTNCNAVAQPLGVKGKKSIDR